MSKSDDYLWDRSGEPDPDVAGLEQLLAPLRHDAPLDELRLRRRRSRWIPLTVSLALGVAAIVAVIVWWRTDGAPPAVSCSGGSGFAFTAKEGPVTCGGAELARGTLPVGGVLDTGAHAAELAIANIGTAELGAETRVRLEHTSGTRHELFLERGRMHARVTAPPRIFAVGTPSGQVTDLGCEYTLEIDRSGAGSIVVQSGMVELETARGTFVVAPAGARARLRAGRRAGIPYSVRATTEMIEAVRAYEEGGADALERVLALATPEDAITVANLSNVVAAAERRAVLERLAALVPPPQELSVDDALADRALFEMWFDEVVLVHMGVSLLPAKKQP